MYVVTFWTLIIKGVWYKQNIETDRTGYICMLSQNHMCIFVILYITIILLYCIIYVCTSAMQIMLYIHSCMHIHYAQHNGHAVYCML